MKRLFATAILAAAFAVPAAAQVTQGTYTGTSADGNSVTVYVGTDPFTNATAVVGAAVYFTAPCKGKTGTILYSGVGYSTNTDFAGNQVIVNFDVPTVANSFTLTFNTTTNTASGTITTAAPDLYPAGFKPTKALFCLSKKQAVSLSYSGAAKVPPYHTGEATPLPARH